jgi:hypothetical protein
MNLTNRSTSYRPSNTSIGIKLKYRGASYQSSNIPIEAKKTESNAKFRGKFYLLSKPRMSSSSYSLKRKYRGVSY